jgi:hypothetical protein
MEIVSEVGVEEQEMLETGSALCGFLISSPWRNDQSHMDTSRKLVGHIRHYLEGPSNLSRTERDNSNFLLDMYGPPDATLWPPTSDLLQSLATRATNPHVWKETFPAPEPYRTGASDLCTLNDHPAAVRATFLTLYAWVTDDAKSLSDLVEETITHTMSSAPPSQSEDWLKPFTDSARHCILVTHAVMAATLYGWAPGNVLCTAPLCENISDMVNAIVVVFRPLHCDAQLKWIVGRVECVPPASSRWTPLHVVFPEPTLHPWYQRHHRKALYEQHPIVYLRFIG